MKNYAVYPIKKMKILQSYDGATSHLPYSTGNIKDYPIDEAGVDSGRDYMLCPCDAMKIVRKYGENSPGTNTIWLQSTKKVVFPDGSTDYLVMMAVHPNDDDMNKVKVGQVFKRGEKIVREGTDGHATGNHFHLSVGKGKVTSATGNGWKLNNKGKWVLSTTGGAFKPEEIFFIDKSMTTVISTKGLAFPELLKTAVKYKITAEPTLRIRKAPTTSSEAVGKYQNGKIVKVLAKKGTWGMTEDGWISLAHAEKV